MRQNAPVASRTTSASRPMRLDPWASRASAVRSYASTHILGGVEPVNTVPTRELIGEHRTVVPMSRGVIDLMGIQRNIVEQDVGAVAKSRTERSQTKMSRRLLCNLRTWLWPLEQWKGSVYWHDNQSKLKTKVASVRYEIRKGWAKPVRRAARGAAKEVPNARCSSSASSAGMVLSSTAKVLEGSADAEAVALQSWQGTGFEDGVDSRDECCPREDLTLRHASPGCGVIGEKVLDGSRIVDMKMGIRVSPVDFLATLGCLSAGKEKGGDTVAGCGGAIRDASTMDMNVGSERNF
ncbi:hypothetical protein BC834DRAFT_844991 [Gloeopeniophorella convolvens]|nr:hypothetical protein BC834DRAFT_844991 [Gloeopeniophorella convolvens]